MPTELINIRTRVLKTSGIHLRFPYGILLPKPGQGQYTNFLPMDWYLGLTVRAFFYAPQASSEAAHFDVHYQATTYYYMAREIVQGTTVKFEYSGRGAYSTSLFGGTTELNLPGYYSLAIRMTKKETKDYLTVLVGDKELGDVDETDRLNYKWELRMKGSVHFLLSLHFSSDTDDTPRKFERKDWLINPPFGISSHWIIEASVDDATKPLTVSLNQDANDPSKDVTALFPLGNVSKGDMLTIFIRSTRGGYLVGTSFDKTTHLVAGTSPRDNYIRPSISDNCTIYRQYAEQGTKKYL